MAELAQQDVRNSDSSCYQADDFNQTFYVGVHVNTMEDVHPSAED